MQIQQDLPIFGVGTQLCGDCYSGGVATSQMSLCSKSCPANRQNQNLPLVETGMSMVWVL
jgi:hypothetical protein